MSAIVLSPAAVAVIERMRATAAAVSQIVEVHPLDTPEAEHTVSGVLRAIKTVHAEAEEERKKLKDPHLRAGREIDEAFREPKRALERVEAMIKRRLAEAAEKRERERREAIEAAKAAVQEGDAEKANEALASIDIAGLDATPAAGISERWTYEPVEFDLRQIPIEYLAVNLPRVREVIREAVKLGQEPKIPGIRFERRAQIAARRLP